MELSEAIESLHCRCSAAEISLKIGTDISSANKILLDYASQCDGKVEIMETSRLKRKEQPVLPKGMTITKFSEEKRINEKTSEIEYETVFVFPKNFKSIARKKSWKEYSRYVLYSVIVPPLFFLFRVSFGIALIVSIVMAIICITILVVIFCSKREGGNNNRFDFGRGNGGGGYGPSNDYWTTRLIIELMRPPLIYHYPVEIVPIVTSKPDHASNSENDYQPGNPPADPDPPRNNSSLNENPEIIDSSMNYFEIVYSWLFGDGDPNKSFTFEQWEALAQYIKSVGGVVIASELRSFQVVPDIGHFDILEEESFMLPILSRFNGVAVSEPHGKFLLYEFPGFFTRGDFEIDEFPLMRLASTPRPFLLEKFWSFSKASSEQLEMVLWLGIFNLSLSVTLFILSCMVDFSSLNFSSVGPFWWGIFCFTVKYQWILILYGVMFLVIPWLRKKIISSWNVKIHERNLMRIRRVDAILALVKSQSQFLQRFILCRNYCRKLHAYKGDSKLLYTTQTHKLEQETNLFIASRSTCD